jgi:YNFM family putative membrane transporter
LGHLREPGLLCLFALAFLLMGGFVTLYNYATFYLLAPPYSLSQSQVALIFLAYAFGAVGSSLMGGLVERIGRPRILYTALLIMATGALLALLKPLAAIVAGIVIFTAGFFGAHAVASAWVGVRAATARAQAASLYLLAYYLGSSISGTGGGFIWSAWGWNGLIALIVGLLGIAAVVVLRLTTLAPQPAGQPEPELTPLGYGPAAE